MLRCCCLFCSLHNCPAACDSMVLKLATMLVKGTCATAIGFGHFTTRKWSLLPGSISWDDLTWLKIWNGMEWLRSPGPSNCTITFCFMAVQPTSNPRWRMRVLPSVQPNASHNGRWGWSEAALVTSSRNGRVRLVTAWCLLFNQTT